MDKKIILASQSPRRRELLALLEEPFQVVSPDVEEGFIEGVDLKEQICDLAKRKAHAVFANHPDAVVISADTIVVYEGHILEKPLNEEKAKTMLRMLSDRSIKFGPPFILFQVSVKKQILLFRMLSFMI